MFNENLIAILRQVNAITNTIKLTYPVTTVSDEARSIFVQIPISEIDSDKFDDITLISKFDRFLNLFKLFPGSRKVEIANDILKVSGNGNSAGIILSDPILFPDDSVVNPAQFSKTLEFPSVVDVDLTVSDIKQIREAISVFKDSDFLSFKSIDGELTISLNSTSTFNSKSDSFDIQKDAKTSKEFCVDLDIDNFLKIPVSDYNLSIKYNETQNAYRFILRNKNLENFQIILARRQK